MLHFSCVNVGQNGDPEDSVRFGHVWGPNGGKPVCPSAVPQITALCEL